MTRHLRAGIVVLIAVLCAASACAGPGAPVGPSIPQEGGATPGGGAVVVWPIGPPCRFPVPTEIWEPRMKPRPL